MSRESTSVAASSARASRSKLRGSANCMNQRRAVAHHRDGDFLVAEAVHHDAEDQRVGERGEAEVDAGQPEGGQADEHGGEHGDARRPRACRSTA